MPTRKTSDSQDRVIEAIKRLVADERSVEQAARIEADELIRSRTAQARNATNALMHSATTEHGITKSAIAARALGNTNRAAIDTRIREHLARHYVSAERTPVFTEEPGVPTAPENAALTVKWDDVRGIVATLDQFTHEDIGSELTGEVVFDSDGTVAEATGDMGPLIEANPLMPMYLWGLEEVQSVVRNA